MDHTTLLIAISFFLPLLVAVLKQYGWSAQANSLVACGVYLVSGVVALLISGQPLTLDNAAVDVGIVMGTGTIAYELFWQNFGRTGVGMPSWEELLTWITSVVKYGPEHPASMGPVHR